MIAPTSGTSGVDWAQAVGVGKSLLLSPLVGFVCAASLLMVAKVAIPRRELYVSPVGTAPPPLWIRLLLILTCTGVSFAHGSNDGQKGMGLIMLILIGTVPTAYALNRAVPPTHVHDFVAVSAQAVDALASRDDGTVSVGEPRDHLTAFIRSHTLVPETVPAIRTMIRDIARELGAYKELRDVPAELVRNFRNDLYIVNEALRLLPPSPTPQMAAARDADVIRQYRRNVDAATKFIPDWVKVAVAIALGLGTMIGWKRIVVTVGEKIGKEHLTYAQGAAAELTAMATIGAADSFGLPVSHHARALVWCRGHDGGQPLGTSVEHDPEPADGVGADASGVDRAVRPAVLALQDADALGGTRWRCREHCLRARTARRRRRARTFSASR